jgi:tRNA-splicing ligase RtcB
MKKRELINMGFGHHELIELALGAVIRLAAAGERKGDLRHKLEELARHPAPFFEDPNLGELAHAVARVRSPEAAAQLLRAGKVSYRTWGVEGIDEGAIRQMDNACALPVAVAGALMPDAHVGYGLPIGGVLATRNAVVPYAVGVDIACRVKLTVLDLPVAALEGQRDRLRKTLENETRFGVGSVFRDRRRHEVMDEDWSVSPITQRSKDKAWSQLGTSGSGNHFVEFGELDVEGDAAAEVGLEPGRYLALLSHSGSRGTGAAVCDHYSKRAMERHPDLPKELRHLAWLDLASEEGREYWAAMELMGRYAAANHALVHRHVAKALGAEVLFDVENHHNFAWIEKHRGENLVVHRKGATPAGDGVLGIIPGSMASPAYVVRGKGEPASLDSASHGAGRLMSRKRALDTFTWSEAKRLLKDRGVELISAGLDEAPMVYREIDQVMAAQSDLVVPLARFFPRLVKMAPAGERAED